MMSVDWNTPDHAMLTRLTQNVFSFSAARNYQELRTITDALRDDTGALRSFSDFKEQVSLINDKFNKTWLATEYSTAITTATSAARWQEFHAQRKMFPFLRYQTAGDEHVRSSHQALDGVVKHVEDPFWSTYYPPNGWHCRCEVIQVPDEDVTPTPNQSIQHPAVPQLFKSNVGRTGLIFPSGHPYYKDVPNVVIRDAITYLPPENGYLPLKPYKGVNVRWHVMHGNQELAGNLEVLHDFISLKPTMREASLLPEVNAKNIEAKTKFYPDGWKFHDKKKNADAVLQFGTGKNKEEWVVDFKRLTGNAEHLGSHLNKAATQADYAIIKLSGKENIDINSFKSKVNKSLSSTPLRGVVLINNDGTLLYEKYKSTTAR